MLDERTIYNYVDAGLLSVGNVDLPRKVRYKVRKKKPSVRVDKQCHLGRTYEDFLESPRTEACGFHPDRRSDSLSSTVHVSNLHLQFAIKK